VAELCPVSRRKRAAAAQFGCRGTYLGVESEAALPCRKCAELGQKTARDPERRRVYRTDARRRTGRPRITRTPAGRDRSRIQEAATRKQELIEGIAEFASELNQIRERMANVRAEISGLSARRELLAQLIETGEGYSSGARALMTWDEKPAGMMSPMVEVLQVPERFRTAISAAMGIWSSHPREEHCGCRSWYPPFGSETGGGRASFLVLDRIDLGMFNQDRHGGVAGFLDSLIRWLHIPMNIVWRLAFCWVEWPIFENNAGNSAADGDWREFSLVGLDGYHLAQVRSSPAAKRLRLLSVANRISRKRQRKLPG